MCGGGYGFFPCANFFFAPNQKQTFVHSQAKEQANLFPLCNATFLPVLWTDFLFFTICWTNYFFITFCWTIFFSTPPIIYSPPPTYHLADPLDLVLDQALCQMLGTSNKFISYRTIMMTPSTNEEGPGLSKGSPVHLWLIGTASCLV